MPDFGVTQEGFTIKGLDVILAESLQRARQAFGPNVDLTATSPLRKILEVTAAEDAELWKRLEDLYYSSFISTGFGESLDLLGEDMGLSRRLQPATGELTFTLNNGAPGRSYVLPAGTRVVTAAPVQVFATLGLLTLTAAAPQRTVGARALERGPAGNAPAGTVNAVEPLYQQFHLNLGAGTSIAVTNARPFTGGDQEESDEEYRAQLLGLPRNLWTLQSIQKAATSVDGVIDVRLFDPLGGVDVAQSFFNLFAFNERLFSAERQIGEPYFFDIVVAHEVAWPWRTEGPAPGIFERVSAAVDRVRPIGIHPNVIQADHIEVGIRARVIVERGHDPQALLAAVKQRIAADVDALKLGGDVLYSQVMGAFVEQAGVVDVQNMHLRRCPAVLGRITFGSVPFQREVLEEPPGENLAMGPTEIATFRVESDLIDLEVVSR